MIYVALVSRSKLIILLKGSISLCRYSYPIILWTIGITICYNQRVNDSTVESTLSVSHVRPNRETRELRIIPCIMAIDQWQKNTYKRVAVNSAYFRDTRHTQTRRLLVIRQPTLADRRSQCHDTAGRSFRSSHISSVSSCRVFDPPVRSSSFLRSINSSDSAPNTVTALACDRIDFPSAIPKRTRPTAR